MMSRTWSCDFMPFRKNITRFAPLWGLYLIGGLVYMISNFGSTAVNAAHVLTNSLETMPIVNFVYAGLVAVMIFGDLYSSKMFNGFYSLPMSRDTWFANYILSGIVFSLVPNLIASVAFMVFLKEYWMIALIWAAVTLLQYLFFFGVAALSCLCVGNLPAMALVYGVANFIAMLAQSLLEVVFLPMYAGLEMNTSFLMIFCPVMKMSEFSSDLFSFGMRSGGVVKYMFSGSAIAWIYMVVTAAIGVGAMFLAALLHRRRALESAGDFIAEKGFKPVFFVVFTLTVSCGMALIGAMLAPKLYILFLLPGVIGGSIVGMMMLMRSTKIFKPKPMIACGVLAAVVMGAVGFTALDAHRYNTWLPKVEDVEYVNVVTPGFHALSISYPESVQIIVDMHRTGIESLDKTPQDWASEGASSVMKRVALNYTMKDGRSFTRIYNLPVEAFSEFPELKVPSKSFFGQSLDEIKEILNGVNADWGYRKLLEEAGADGTPAKYISYSWYGTKLPTPELLEVLGKDFDAGHVQLKNGNGKQGDDCYWLYLQPTAGRLLNISIGPECTYTFEFLENYRNGECKVQEYEEKTVGKK